MEAEATRDRTYRLTDIIERLLEFDFTRPLAFAAFAVFYVATRIPWLNLGYGTDPDAWRVALSADHLLSHGEYLPSRLPGFPLEEFVTVPLVRLGWVWTNLSTVCISLVGVYVFARLLSELKLPSKGLLTVAFAFTPLLWINSVMTMDYMWSLTFILSCYLLLIRRHFLLAGLCMGLAIGFRLTAVWVSFAFLAWLWREKQLRAAVPFLGATGVVSLIAFSPVLATYGLRMFNFYDAKVGLLTFLKLLGKDTLGLVGAVAVLAGIAVSLPRLVHIPRDALRNSHVFLWVLVPLLVFGSFTRLPHEVAYLIPLFPFGFFLMARYFRRPVLVGVAVLIVLSGFVDMTSPGDEAVTRATFTSAQIGAGMTLSDLQTLRSQRDYVQELANADIAPHSVVLVGSSYPEFAMRNKSWLDLGIIERDYKAISMLTDKGQAVDKVNDVYYFWLLSYDDFRSFQEQGYNFYYVFDAEGGNAAVYHFRPAYYGATEILGKVGGGSGGKGTAGTHR